MFLSYYLQDLTVENGCLQVIPGSHLRRLPLHDELQPLLGRGEHGAVLVKDISTDEELLEKDQDEPRQHSPPLFNEDHPLAVDVYAKAGDLVIADARVLHAARHNQTDSPRDLLLLWHSRPGGQNNRGAPWSVPSWYDGELPGPLAAREPNAEYEGTRIPGELLRPEGPWGAAAQAAVQSSSKL